MKKRKIGSAGGQVMAIRQREMALKNYYENPNICQQCGEIIKVFSNQKVADIRKKKFCSQNCFGLFRRGNSYKPSSQKQFKIVLCRRCSKKKKFNLFDSQLVCYDCKNESKLDKVCPKCKKHFKVKKWNATQIYCSMSCSNSVKGIKGGKTKHFVKCSRSKNEIAFYNLCKSHFKNVKHNEKLFNGWDADIIIEDIKVAVLWNGKWHYEKIIEQHSLKQVQNRDRIKIKEIEKCGYKPYIIKDMGRENKEKVENEFQQFIKWAE